MTSFADQRLLDLKTVAERTGISLPTWRRIVRAGGIGVLRIEGTIRIPESELSRYLAERFIPARPLHRGPVALEDILDRVAPRRRGRPRVAGDSA